MSTGGQGDEHDQLPGDASREKSGARGRRREAARAKAVLARQRRQRRARTTRFALQGGLVVVVIAIAVGVVLVIRSLSAPAGPGPANMAGDGITIGKGFTAVQATPLPAAATPTVRATQPATDTVDIAVYYDYLCPICGSFEKADNEYIRGLVRSGAATVEYHPLAILGNQSLGTKYSNRAANAAACVATSSPDAFFDFNAAMFAAQPREGTAGLSDQQLAGLVKRVPGMTNTDRIARCISHQAYASWVTSATRRALTGPIPGAAISKISSTPTILVNGQLYRYSTPFRVDEFSSFVVTAAGNTFATATPTSSATPTR